MASCKTLDEWDKLLKEQDSPVSRQPTILSHFTHGQRELDDATIDTVNKPCRVKSAPPPRPDAAAPPEQAKRE